MHPLSDLAARHCQPVPAGTSALAGEPLQTLLAVLPGWELVEQGRAICKTFRFPDYYRTMAFVNALAFHAHATDHHPDLGVHFDRCVVRYSSHDAGGLSMNDFICAARAEMLGAAA